MKKLFAGAFLFIFLFALCSNALHRTTEVAKPLWMMRFLLVKGAFIDAQDELMGKHC